MRDANSKQELRVSCDPVNLSTFLLSAFLSYNGNHQARHRFSATRAYSDSLEHESSVQHLHANGAPCAIRLVACIRRSYAK